MKRYRVTQYETLSELGMAFHAAMRGPSDNTPQELGHKDYRWLWLAKLSAAWHRGESPGLGLRVYTTTIEEIHE